MNTIIYTSNHCPYCDGVKNYFDKKNIAYTEKHIDLDESAYNELLTKLNGNFRGTPVIDVDGVIVEGFDTAKLDVLTS